MQVGTVFNEVCQMLEESGVGVMLPEEVGKAGEKLGLLKEIVGSLLERLSASKEGKEKREEAETDAIACEDCQNYEASLQKLEQ
jgi:hypothetical protein